MEKKSCQEKKGDKTESTQSRIGIRGLALIVLHINWVARKK
jgi:hypothetical protein